MGGASSVHLHVNSQVHLKHIPPPKTPSLQPSTHLPLCGATHPIRKFVQLRGLLFCQELKRPGQRTKSGLPSQSGVPGMPGAVPRKHCNLSAQQEMVLRISVQ